MSMKYKLNAVLKHPGYNGGGGGGLFIPNSSAPGFSGPSVRAAPTAPMAPQYNAPTNYGSNLASMSQYSYNPYGGYGSPFGGGYGSPFGASQPQYQAQYQPQPMYSPFQQLDQQTQQYNQFGPQMQDFSRARRQYNQDYATYRGDVNNYNTAAQNYKNTYGSGYNNYSAPSQMTAQPMYGYGAQLQGQGGAYAPPLSPDELLRSIAPSMPFGMNWSFR